MDNYYTGHAGRLLWFYDVLMKRVRRHMVKEYGGELADRIIAEGRQRFEAILPEIPYIGGLRENTLTFVLIFTGLWIAVYRVMESYGKSAEEMAVTFYKTFARMYNMPPRFMSRLIGRVMLSRFGLVGGIQKLAKRSQERKYPGDWVFTMKQGDGEEYDWITEYTECGAVKFLKAQGADALLPYCNFSDIAMSKAFDMGMEVCSLGEGCETCVAHFKLGRETPLRDWIPR